MFTTLRIHGMLTVPIRKKPACVHSVAWKMNTHALKINTVKVICKVAALFL